MLTSTSYAVALTCLWISSLLGLVLIYRFWLRSLTPAIKRPLAGLLCALLVTPVYPSPEANTLAPALVVAVFNAAFLDGWVSARHAVWILSGAGVTGLVLGSLSLLFSRPAPRRVTAVNPTSDQETSSVQP